MDPMGLKTWLKKPLEKYTLEDERLEPTAITRVERKRIWTKPPWGHVPAVNLPECKFFPAVEIWPPFTQHRISGCYSRLLQAQPSAEAHRRATRVLVGRSRVDLESRSRSSHGEIDRWMDDLQGHSSHTKWEIEPQIRSEKEVFFPYFPYHQNLIALNLRQTSVSLKVE